MVDEFTAMQVKRTIKFFISLPYLIEQQEFKQHEHQIQAYNRQSLTGTSRYGFMEEDYTHAINIEKFVTTLIMEQQAIDRKLDYLRLCHRLFKELVFLDKYPTLKSLGKHKVLTKYELAVYHEIQEIEYYIRQHKRTKERLQAKEQVSELTHDEIEQIIEDDTSETPQEIKISVLSNVEDELLEMLT